jgi:site-specific recombinase XerD
MKKSSKSNSKAGTANPLTGSVQSISGMPTKLKIYRVASSKFWWARVYLDGRYRMSSLKTEKLRDAQEAAKKFFYQALLDAQLGTRPETNTKVSRSFVAVGSRFIESQNVPDKVRRYNDDRIRFNKELVTYFGEKDIGDITSADVGALAKKLQLGGLAPATTNQYLIVLRKILKYACDNRLISSVPNFPRVKGKSTMTKRDFFPMEEYRSLVSVIEEMADERVEVRGVPVTLEFKYLVQFMVNSFIRPSDLRVLRRPHVKVQVNPSASRNADKHYLLLTHPATKTTDQEVVTMPAAYGIYQSLVKFQDEKVKALKAKKSKVVDKFTDHLFFPEYANRDTMIAVAGRIFRKVVQRANLEKEGEKHTLYSLRHTSIMYRLLLGNTSTLELARNARTSQAMIDKHYASRLTPLMAVDSIHSFKANPAPAKTPVKKVTKKAAAAKQVARNK